MSQRYDSKQYNVRFSLRLQLDCECKRVHECEAPIRDILTFFAGDDRCTYMHGDWFFDTARGKIVAALRGRPGASAFDLAREFGLSTNAVRQQFILLERDGLVTASNVRRGKTKPTVEYRLTRAAEKIFPQHYDRMLNAVLREVRAAGGDDAVGEIFDSMSRRRSDQLNANVEERPVADRVAALTD